MPGYITKNLIRALCLCHAAVQLPSASAAGDRAEESQVFGQHQVRDAAQKLLGATPGTSGLFTKKQQEGELCPTYGESQWTGSITVDEGHDIFYWFFHSRHDPENDPVIVSFAGGPGASSELSMLQGAGPCSLDESLKPAPNPWSWSNNASLLFIDQPTGTGFSKLAPGLPLPNTEQETAKDFQRFLNIFFKQAFPEKKHLPIHIYTGSYGGHYGPVYLHHILESRRKGSDEAFLGNIESLILSDAVTDWTGTFLGVYPLLCENPQSSILNATACESIKAILAEQERLGAQCRETYDLERCKEAFDHGAKYIHGPYMDQRGDLSDSKLRTLHLHIHMLIVHIFKVHRKCPDDAEYPACDQPLLGAVRNILDQDWVKEALDLPTSLEFKDVNMEMWTAFHESGAWYAPTTRELVDVLDAYSEVDKVGDIRVLLLNGNSDFIVNTPGNMWHYDRLAWTGQSEYQSKEFQPLPEGLAATGSWKGTGDGRLVFVAIDEATHFMKPKLREGYSRIVDKWIRHGWEMP